MNIFQQGPLEKSLQDSVSVERQKNMDNRVGIIRASVLVTHTRRFREFQNKLTPTNSSN